jgi:hypothetical protein
VIRPVGLSMQTVVPGARMGMSPISGATLVMATLP